jgi:prepilin-type N-terminal cleavage/methylation domain-containing protein
MIRRARRGRQSGITLIELLVALVVVGILSTMIIGTWISLTNAYSFTSRSDKQRDFARQAIERMAREIRDAQEPSGSPHRAFASGHADEVRFYSAFNTADAPDPSSQPRLTRFIYRVTNSATGTGSIYREFPGLDSTFGTDDDVSQLLVKNVVNAHAGRDVFTFNAYDSSGNLAPMTGTLDPARIATVGIALLVDLNPGQSPNYMDISTVVQPRNVREY